MNEKTHFRNAAFFLAVALLEAAAARGRGRGGSSSRELSPSLPLLTPSTRKTSKKKAFDRIKAPGPLARRRAPFSPHLSLPTSLSSTNEQKKRAKKKGKKDSRGKQVKILISYSRARHFQKKRKKRFERSTGLDERRRKKNDPSVGPSSSDRRLVPAAQRVL